MPHRDRTNQLTKKDMIYSIQISKEYCFEKYANNFRSIVASLLFVLVNNCVLF